MDNLLNNLRIDSFYKLIIYLSGVILIASLFFPVKYLDQPFIFKLALKFLMLGISYWILDTFCRLIVDFIKDQDLANFFGVVYIIIFYVTPFIFGYLWLMPLFK